MPLIQADYTITVKTSEVHVYSGAIWASVEIQLQSQDEDGNVQSSEWIELNNPGFEFGRGDFDVFEVKTTHVGVPSVIKLRKKGCDKWCCEWVEVKSGNLPDERVRFPVYDYVSNDEVTVLSARTLLPQEGSVPLEWREARAREIARQAELVGWIERGKAVTSLMRYVRSVDDTDLPDVLRRSTERKKMIVGKGLVGKLNAKLQSTLGNLVYDLDTLEDYAKIYRRIDGRGQQQENFLEGWDTDEGFGRQILCGVEPLLFEKCTKLPSYFNVTNQDLVGVLDKTDSLDKAMQEGRMYISDFTEIYKHDPSSPLKYTPLENGQPCQVAHAVALFYVNANKKFLPVAIQLAPDKREHLFVSDGSQEWLLAKMYFRNASFSFHEWIVHYLYCHATVEPFCVALFRCLSPAHPVHKLLRPHIANVCAMNGLARVKLLPEGSDGVNGVSIDAVSMAQRMYKDFNFQDRHIPRLLKKRGVDVWEIPEYYYGQDTVRVWRVIEDYVTRIINLYYVSDEAVKGDFELQEMARQLVDESFGWESEERPRDGKGVPRSFETRQQLIDTLTIVIGTASAQHAAVNFAQYESYKFSPNCPGIMRLPIHKRGDFKNEEEGYQRIMDTLPSIEQVAGIVSVNFILSSYSKDENYLGEIYQDWFNEPEAREIINTFKSDLRKLDDDIDRRNYRLVFPYVYQKPSKIPNSISI